MKSTFRGTSNNGGIVGVVHKDGSEVTVYSCLFDGTMDGRNAMGWGGIVGWKEKGTVVCGAASLCERLRRPSLT